MSDIIRRCGTSNSDPEKAVDELARGLEGPGLNGVIFFCHPYYDQESFVRAMVRKFQCPVIGCTTAGEILSPGGYGKRSVVALGFATPAISMTPVFIPGISSLAKDFDPARMDSLISIEAGTDFALLLIDGLSMLEERITALVHGHLRGIPLIGGSAGDGLRFNRTGIYWEGAFHSDAAVLTLFRTTLPFKTFQIQHFLPTETRLVITEADVPARTVMEINGLPAAVEYARTVGVDRADLSDHVFAEHPLMLKVGGRYYVRSIQRVNPDESLTFYCAIDNGLVLTLGKAANLLDNLKFRLSEISSELAHISVILGCDCILRKIELEKRGELDRAGDILSGYPFIGFSTYGEQFGGIHVNQTLTGVAIGGADGNSD